MYNLCKLGITVKSLDFGWGLPILHPVYPPCAVSPWVGRRNLQIFEHVSGFLQIYVLFHLKVTKLFAFTAIMAWPKPINEYLLKNTNNNYNVLLIKDKQRLYQYFYCCQLTSIINQTTQCENPRAPRHLSMMLS